MALEDPGGNGDDGVWHRTKSTASTWVLRVFAFLGVLFVLQQTVLYFLRSHETHVAFRPQFFESHSPEDSIQHQKIAATNPGHDKALVVASLEKENTDWVLEHFSDEWETNIFIVDNAKSDLTVLRQGGKESAGTRQDSRYYARADILSLSHLHNPTLLQPARGCRIHARSPLPMAQRRPALRWCKPGKEPPPRARPACRIPEPTMQLEPWM